MAIPQRAVLPRCVLFGMLWLSVLPAPDAAVSPTPGDRTFYYDDLIGNATYYCYEKLINDSSCCLDQNLAPGVTQRNVSRPEAAWNCDAGAGCLDTLPGPRGTGSMWLPEGSDCTTPRILYVHGGSWLYSSPFTDGYPALLSRIAQATSFVVYALDYPLVPIGNASTILDAAVRELDWLARNGPDGPCPLPVPPLFIGGDSSGGGSAFSTVLELIDKPQRRPYGGMVMLTGAFFFSPWTNLECNTPDYFFNAYAKIPPSENFSRMPDAHVGDLVFRGKPLDNTGAFTGNARQYVNDREDLLRHPIYSPINADPSHWGAMPPLYFAVGGSESIMGDSVLLAQKVSHHHVDVQLDIYQGMWHVFPMYSEGCGYGGRLWQADSAMQRTARFVRSLAFTGFPACTTFPNRGGATPFTMVHYANPDSEGEWFEDQESCSLDGALTSAGAPSLVEEDSQRFSGTVALAVIVAFSFGALVVDNVRLRRRVRRSRMSRELLLS